MFRKLLLIISLFFMPFLSYGQFLSVCERTPQVRDIIMAKTALIDPSIECSDDDLMKLVLSEFEELIMVGQGITSLKIGDFSGLSSLRVLSLYNNKLTTLPKGVFSELSSVTSLALSSNQLTTFPEGVFYGLSSLEIINLSNNPLDVQAISRVRSVFGSNKISLLQ